MFSLPGSHPQSWFLNLILNEQQKTAYFIFLNAFLLLCSSSDFLYGLRVHRLEKCVFIWASHQRVTVLSQWSWKSWDSAYSKNSQDASRWPPNVQSSNWLIQSKRLVLTLCSDVSDMGHRRTAPLQEHVGALLSRGQRYRVSYRRSARTPGKSSAGTFHNVSVLFLQLHGGCSRHRENRRFQKWITQPFRETTTTRNSCEKCLIFGVKHDVSLITKGFW